MAKVYLVFLLQEKFRGEKIGKKFNSYLSFKIIKLKNSF